MNGSESVSPGTFHSCPLFWNLSTPIPCLTQESSGRGRVSSGRGAGEPGRDLQVELVDVGGRAHLQHVADDELTEHGQHVSPVEQLVQLVRVLLLVNSAGPCRDSRPLPCLPVPAWPRRSRGAGGDTVPGGLGVPASSPCTGAGTAVAQNHHWTCRPPERRPRATEEARSVTGSPCSQVSTTWPGLPHSSWQHEPRTHVPGKCGSRPRRARAPDEARPSPTLSLHRPSYPPGCSNCPQPPRSPRGPPYRSTAAPRPPAQGRALPLPPRPPPAPGRPTWTHSRSPPSLPQVPGRLTCSSGLLQKHVLLDEGEELALQDVVGDEEQQPQARVLLRALVAEDEEQVTQQDEGLKGARGCGVRGHRQGQAPTPPRDGP